MLRDHAIRGSTAPKDVRYGGIQRTRQFTCSEQREDNQMTPNQIKTTSRGGLHSVLATTTVCVSLLAAQGVLAQEAVESAMAPLPQGHGPLQMTISINS